jgi:hypothetical protein
MTHPEPKLKTRTSTKDANPKARNMKSKLLIYGITLAVASVSQAGYTPIAIQTNSYNADVIVESNARPTLTISTTASVDNGTNNTANTWFETGFDTANPGNGLPAAGSTFTALDDATHSFTMAPSYTAPNGILIDTAVTNGTFTLVTPAVYTKLSFLGSGGNGGDTINVLVKHQNGAEETGSFGCPDWFGGSGVAYIAGGRCNSTVNLTTEVDGNSGDGRANPRIYFRDITLTNTTSPVTSIELTYASGQASSHNDIMGVSGATPTSGTTVAPIAVTGYDYDFVVEAGAPKNGRVTSQIVVDGTNVFATTQSMDTELNTGNSWYEKGYNINNADSGTYNSPTQDLTGTGLPHPGSFITNATGDHIYQMPSDYTINNAVYIGTPASMTNATITLATPAAFTGLSFLGSAANGPVTVNAVINHQGGTSETNTLTVNDWFDASVPFAYIANGRVAVDTAQYGGVNGNTPRLLESDLVLSDSVHPVTSIYLENTNTTGGRLAIFAVSGSTGALPPIIAQQPGSVNAYFGSSVSFTSTATANAPITYQWQKGTNGVFVNLSNGGSISGVTTTNLNISPIGFGDQADYQLVATDSAGFADSATATLGVFSTNTDVTQPGDAITGVNISAFGDGSPAFAIDDSMNTKFGANISGGVPGLVITPSVGRTVVSALRIYTGADTPGRDPSSYELQGSTDGGSTYTLISSNSITLTDNRNPLVAVAPDPLTQFVTEVRFANLNGYTTYKLSFPTEKGSGQIQFQELELLGTNDTSHPFFSTQPVDARAYGAPTSAGADSASFTAIASYTPTPTVSWSKGTNGVYVALKDGGNISGSQTTTLSLNPTTFADAADYIAVANSTAGFVTSSVAHLFIYSTNVDVSQPGDTITGFGDTTGTRYGGNALPENAIDDAFTEWQNGGSGLNASAGFPPFGGPVGVVVTPAVGSTVLAGLRVYPGQDALANDPNGFVLEGSNNGGTNYSPIASGPLSLPAARNSIGLNVDPLQASVQEVLFSNTRGFTTYRLTFPSVVDPNTASYLEVGDVEFLGVPGVGLHQPVVSSPKLSGGNLTLGGSGGPANATYTVRTNATLAVPVAGWGAAATGTFDSSGNFSISLPVNPANPHLFYLIQTP